jgi:hypothetical protein
MYTYVHESVRLKNFFYFFVKYVSFDVVNKDGLHNPNVKYDHT